MHTSVEGAPLHLIDTFIQSIVQYGYFYETTVILKLCNLGFIVVVLATMFFELTRLHYSCSKSLGTVLTHLHLDMLS